MSTPQFTTLAIIHHIDAQPPGFRYGLAVLAVAAAAVTTHLIPVVGGRAAFLLFFFATIQASFWLGLKPGLLAMALAIIVANASVLGPIWRLSPADALTLNGVFGIFSAVMIATTSHHRRLALALREKEQDLAHAQTIGQIGSWRLDTQHHTLHGSDEFHRIFGIPKGTPLDYETLLASVHPDDVGHIGPLWQTGWQGGAFDIEHRIIVAGGVKWLREKAVLEVAADGQLLAGFGTAQDITDRKRGELALAESQSRYAGIVESALDAIIAIDGGHRIVLFNAAAEKIFGCVAAEAIGSPLSRFIPERFHAIHERHIRDFGQIGGTSRQMGEPRAVTGLRANGEEFPIEASISQTRTADGASFTVILRDISGRLQAETALYERLNLQEQLAKVAATVPGVICSFRLRPDGSTAMPYASPMFESVYGLSAATVTDDFSPVFARIHPDDRGHIHATIAESARTLQPWQDSFRYQHPSKGEIWIEGHSMPLREGDGSILWEGYIQDVTGRKQAEAALHESEERMRLATDQYMLELQTYHIELEMQNEELRQTSVALETSRTHYFELYDFAPVGYLTLTEAGLIAEINLTGAQLLGMTRQQLLHQRFAAFIADDQQNRWQAFFLQARQPDGKHAIELPLRQREDGTRLFAHIDCQHTQLGDALAPLRIALTDITEHTLTEAALRASEARLALVIEAVKASYWDWDLLNHTLYLSPEWKRQTGFDDDESPDRWEKWANRLHPDDRASVLAATKNYLKGQQPSYELEFRMHHQDGSYRWFHSRGALLCDADNHPYRMLGINLDITDYKSAKELHEQREQMEQSSRLYVAAQTAAAIAHEMNQPLTAISAYADVALQLLQTGHQNSPKLAHVIENCALQAQRAGQVIRQLLALLQKGETLSEPIDINASVHEAVDFIRADGQPKPFKITLALADGLPPVAANRLQVQKVLVNLVRNGLESMQESGGKHGVLTVATQRSQDDPTLVRVTVCDSGKGVADAAALKTIFQPFYTTKPTGLGMGLGISRALIEAHGGAMWAEQNPEAGISVHFTLPFLT